MAECKTLNDASELAGMAMLMVRFKTSGEYTSFWRPVAEAEDMLAKIVNDPEGVTFGQCSFFYDCKAAFRHDQVAFAYVDASERQKRLAVLLCRNGEIEIDSNEIEIKQKLQAVEREKIKAKVGFAKGVQ